MLKRFQELGDSLATDFAAVHYDNLAFPELATRALERARLCDELTPEAILRWIMRQRELPEQADLESTFGEPPVTVYRNERFFIEVLFWKNDATSIHQHGFSGAFQVLSGTSIHAEYHFALADRATLLLGFGELSQKYIETLHCGDIRTIRLGDTFIHANYHVESPTVTIVVRTTSEPWHSPQYSYVSPGVRWSRLSRSKTRLRQMQALQLTCSRYPELARESIRALVDLDLVTAFSVFHDVIKDPKDELFEDSLSYAIARHGDRMAILGEAVAIEHERHLLSNRVSESDASLRFFVGALLHATSRASLYELLGKRFTGLSPPQLLVDLSWRLLEQRFRNHSPRLAELVKRILTVTLVEGRSAPEAAALVDREFSVAPTQSAPLFELVKGTIGDKSLRPLLESSTSSATTR